VFNIATLKKLQKWLLTWLGHENGRLKIMKIWCL